MPFDISKTLTVEEVDKTPVALPRFPAATGARGRVAARALGAAVLGAQLMVLFELPWAVPAAGAPLATLLFLPFSTVVAALMTLSLARLERTGRWVSGRTMEELPSAVLVAFVAFGTLLAGAYASNVCFLDPPTSGYTLYGYAGTALLALTLSVVAKRLLATPTCRNILAFVGWRTGLAALALVAGAGTAVLDATMFVRTYSGWHLALAAIALTAFTATTLLWSRRARNSWMPRHLVVAMTVIALASAVCEATRPSTMSTAEVLARHPTAPRRVLALARQLFDRDGDGFSAALGGGDCDDFDPKAFPLSTVGNDCTGIIGGRLKSGDDAAPTDMGTPTAAPRVIVLVTVDTFRCGFGIEERPELLNACPNLTRLAHEGRFRLGAHAPYPATLRSISVMQTVVGESAEPRFLPPALADHGFRSAVVATHPRILEVPGLRATYDVVDESLAPRAHIPSEVTSEQVTDLTQRLVVEALRSGGRRFVWAHYFDPHGPYVREPGTHLTYSRIESYAAEIRRTDAAIGRLVETIRTAATGTELAIVMTADHGEEFGEHRGTEHGTTLYEEVVRVPFLAWRSGTDSRAGLPDPVPARGEETAPYILSLASGAPFASHPVASMRADPAGDAQLGIVFDNWKYIYHPTLGYSELFDLVGDPREAHDRSATESARMRVMRAELGRQLALTRLDVGPTKR